LHRLIVTLCTLILLAAGEATAAEFAIADSAADASPLPSIKILADSEEYDWATERFSAQGNVRVTYGETLLTADSVLGNPFTGEVQAAGNVTFENGTRTLTGESFTYNYKTNEGIAGNASAVVDNVYFRGKELKSAPDKYTLTGSRFTTCDEEHPHYYLSARELEIIPEKKLIARGVSIYLYGTRLISVPKYSVGLDKEHKTPGFKLPVVGVSGRYGVFAGYSFDMSSGASTVGRLNARMSTREVFQGGLEYDRIAGQPVFFRASYRERYYGGTNPYTLLTRMPEVGVRYGTKNAFEAYSSVREPLNLSRSLLDPRQPISRHGMNLIGEVSAGRFTENPDNVTSNRLDTRLVAWMDPVPLHSNTFFSPGISARFSHYDTGDDYSSVGFSLGVGRRFGQQSYGSLTYTANSIQGTTPFGFDVVEIPHELAGRVGFPVGSLFLEVGGRYDLTKGLMYDSEVSIAKRLHCLEPKLTWRNRFRQFSIDVGVVGF